MIITRTIIVKDEFVNIAVALKIINSPGGEGVLPLLVINADKTDNALAPKVIPEWEVDVSHKKARGKV